MMVRMMIWCQQSFMNLERGMDVEMFSGIWHLAVNKMLGMVDLGKGLQGHHGVQYPHPDSPGPS
jgi:hypothetical protein